MQRKSFNKAQYPLMFNTKATSKRTLNIVKALYDKPKVNVLLNRGKLKTFPPKSVKRMSILTTLVQHNT